MPRASRHRTYSCVRSVPKFVKRRNRMHTCSGRIFTRSAGFDLVRTVQPLSLHIHSMKAATALGEHASIFTFEMFRVPYGSGMGSAIIEGCVAHAGTPPSSAR